MLIREWMSAPPIVARELLSAPGALWLMEERNVRRLPVVDDEGRLRGIVTRGDLLEKLGPYPISWRRLNLKVSDAMTPDPATVRPDEPVERAAQLMLERKIGGLPVVEGGRPVGIVTESDLFRALCRAFGVPRVA
jgi:acetoin utilization protein AcuB